MPHGCQRVVSKESDDGRDVPDLGRGCVAFPVGNREFMDADLLGNLRLEEAKVKSADSDMVS